MKCQFCYKEITTTNGICDCTNQNQILGRAIFKTPELKTWQCPFCKMVYNEYVPSCDCQNRIKSESEETK